MAKTVPLALKTGLHPSGYTVGIDIFRKEYIIVASDGSVIYLERSRIVANQMECWRDLYWFLRNHGPVPVRL